jgi:Spy/CpxP family protein refolding chaperone
MLRKLLCTLTVATALGIAGSAMAQSSHYPSSNRAGPTASGKFLAIPGLYPLSMPNVQREIGLTAEQKQQLKSISDGYTASMQRLDKTFEQLEPEEKQKQAKDFGEMASQSARNAQRRAEGVLDVQQLQAVRKIAFELSATRALADPNVQEKIGLSPAQREHLNQLFERAGEKMQELQRETAQQAAELLDEDQAAELKKQVDSPQRPQ